MMYSSCVPTGGGGEKGDAAKRESESVTPTPPPHSSKKKRNHQEEPSSTTRTVSFAHHDGKEGEENKEDKEDKEEEEPVFVRRMFTLRVDMSHDGEDSLDVHAGYQKLVVSACLVSHRFHSYSPYLACMYLTYIRRIPSATQQSA